MNRSYNKHRLDQDFMKCKCGKPSEPRQPEWMKEENRKYGRNQFVTAYRGPNNTELCCKCAKNICSVCQKKGKRKVKRPEFKYVGPWDRHGNYDKPENYQLAGYNTYLEEMIRVEEKDPDNPSGAWNVYYCNEHLPLWWKQKKEKLWNENSYWLWKYHGFSERVDDQEMVWEDSNDIPQFPDKKEQPKQKPVLPPDNKKPTEPGKFSRLVKLESLDYDQKFSSNWDLFWFVFVSSEGEKFEVNSQNLSLWQRTAIRKSGPNIGDKDYWYKLSWKGTQKDKRKFEKGDFIEIEKQEQSPENSFKNIQIVNKENSRKNNSSTNPIKNSPNKVINETLIINLKSIKKIILNGENLIIEFNKNGKTASAIQTINAEQINNNQELQTVKNYCQKNNKTSLNQQELSSLITPNSISTKEPKKNNLPLLIGSGVTILGLGVVIGLLVKKRVKKTK